MGLFDKKTCDVCGEKIGLLGNRKLEDGNICKDCAKKLSKWFDDRRHSTLAEIQVQLELRENNQNMLQYFNPGRVIESPDDKIYIDDMRKEFVVSGNLKNDDNPDIIMFDSVTGCNLDVQEHRSEEYYTNSKGERESYHPPRYKCSYDYYLYIYLQHPYLDEMKLSLNNFAISDRDHRQRHEVERAGQEMIHFLQSVSGGAGMNMGMPNQNMMNQSMGMGMNPNIQGGMDMQNPNMMNHDMPNRNVQGMPMGAAGTAPGTGAPDSGPWTCPSCGAVNGGKFCECCGSPRK